MSRINSNIGSLIAQRNLGQRQADLQTSLQRLSTGLRINRGADDPAGLIASEKLRSDKVSLAAALGNAERADQVLNTAEGGLQEINSLLLEVQSLVGQSANDAGLSVDEKEANQQQIDQILATIDRLASTTSFEGSKLLNGGFDFTVSGLASTVSDYKVNGAKIAQGGSVTVKALVTASAQHGGLFLSAGAAALNLSASTATFAFEVAGTKGTREFSFASGTALTDVRDTINNFKSITGVSAAVSGTGIVLKTENFGSTEFVSVKVTNNGGQAGTVLGLSSIDEDVAKTAGTAFASATAFIKDSGQDVSAVVNGIVARGKGKVATVNTDALDVEIELSTAAAQSAASITAFTITGGGAKFNLGPTIDVGNQVILGLPSVAARNLGSVSTGYLDSIRSGATNNLVDGNLEDAQTVVNKSIDQISKLRGRLGSTQTNVVGATIRSLGVALENTTAAESVIRDTDFAAETSALTRSQILVTAAQSALGIANAQPQAVLNLLR